MKLHLEFSFRWNANTFCGASDVANPQFHLFPLKAFLHIRECAEACNPITEQHTAVADAETLRLSSMSGEESPVTSEVLRAD